MKNLYRLNRLDRLGISFVEQPFSSGENSGENSFEIAMAKDVNGLTIEVREYLGEIREHMEDSSDLEWKQLMLSVQGELSMALQNLVKASRTLYYAGEARYGKDGKGV